MTDLLELADRCERADDLNFTIDEMIASAVGFTVATRSFTRSLDAARSLYPYPPPDMIPSDPRKACAAALRARAAMESFQAE